MNFASFYIFSDVMCGISDSLRLCEMVFSVYGCVGRGLIGEETEGDNVYVQLQYGRARLVYARMRRVLQRVWVVVRWFGYISVTKKLCFFSFAMYRKEYCRKGITLCIYQYIYIRAKSYYENYIQYSSKKWVLNKSALDFFSSTPKKRTSFF